MAKKGTRLLLWVAAIGLLLTVVVVVAAVLLTQDDFGVDKDTQRWLYVDFADLNDAPATPGIFDDPDDLAPLTTEMTQLIHDAATDQEVPGLLVEIGSLSVGWAQAEELRDALKEFRASGKPCIAWAQSWSNKGYYIGSACNEVQVMPTGLVLVNGLAVTQTYYAGTFEKLDIRPNFEHVGNFKSAVEVYQRTGPSKFAAQAMNVLLDSLFDQLVTGVAEGRGVSTEQAKAWIDDPPLAVQDALDQGLIDRLAFRDQVKDQVELYGGAEPPAEAAANAPPPRAPLTAQDADNAPDEAPSTQPTRHELRHYRDYLKSRRKAWSHNRDTRIAVLYAEGEIVNGSGGDSAFGSHSIGDRSLNKEIRDIREDDDIDALVLRVNSPGGSGSASDAIWRELMLTKAVKPVVVSMADYAASGGYYISMGADYIVAQPGTLTGSIGVFGGKMNLAGTMAKVGLSQHTFQRGAQSTLLSGVHDFDEAGRERFRRFLEVFYQTFVSKAAAGRGMSFDDLHAVAQGRVWTGEQALDRGLVDALGGLDLAITKAAELSGSSASLDDITVVRYPERKSFFEQLIDQMEGTDPTVSASLSAQELAELAVARAAPGTAQAIDDLLVLQQILNSGDVAALLPGHIDIR
ncbi:MAG: signal peptide peptidase SppA [Oligoflexia bacterium]|nr:signal peptide peptidase SppA [Oligoflexia bacterium]